ncbi:flagellar hook-length control protein FliK [Paenibacillus naphthalenovorans]|uniref:Flagellar hook-length control protein FliK n=1 Tax=Paenibacillus naphthalenovorans TaxID=162209 RepID=A0A0U2W2A0_9BACL|nr:flagellar hook-length control protein FliK [Paenibacillus naphthalenovorans]ALS21637.1 flagellar hook-length control protein FliK [Paenibacillus naphthalenovorans]
MEITAQTSTAGSVGTTAGGTAGAVNSGTGGSGFSTTLNGMLISAHPQAGKDSASAATGLSVLTGLITPILMAAVQTDESAAALTGEQIQGLIQLLEKPQDGEEEHSLLSNPDLQAWLVQLQSILAALTPNPQNGADDGTWEGGLAPVSQANDHLEEALNPMLFIPLIAAAPTAENQGTEGESSSTIQAGISLSEAVQMLNRLKEMIEQGHKDPQLQQTLKELSAVLVSAAASESHLRKEAERADRPSQPSLIVKPIADVETSGTQETIRVAANPLSKLEMLAAKQSVAKHSAEQLATDVETSGTQETVRVATAQLSKLELLAVKHTVAKLSAEQPAIQDQPLFEPLVPADSEPVNGQHPVMTVQDWMKGAQAGNAMPKHPVLHMSAGTFANDMTQFVVSSFSLATSADGLTEAKISLFPQHLGHVEVKLTMHNGMLVAQFMADSLSGKEMLESQLTQLRTTLQNQGIQVEKLEVGQSQSFQSGMFQEDRRQQSSGQSSKQNKSGRGSVESMEEEQPINISANLNKALNDKGSIDVTA